MVATWKSIYNVNDNEKKRKRKRKRKIARRRGDAGKCGGRGQVPLKAQCTVYALSEPDGQIRYVGQTRTTLDRRLHFHIEAASNPPVFGRKHSPVQLWLRDLLSRGVKPEIGMLAERVEWDIAEAVFIDRLRREGYDLLNVNSVVNAKLPWE